MPPRRSTTRTGAGRGRSGNRIRTGRCTRLASADDSAYREARRRWQALRCSRSRRVRALPRQSAVRAASGGAERLADGELALPARPTRQQETRYNRARDQDHNPCYAEEHHEEDKEAAIVAFARNFGVQPAKGSQNRNVLREVRAAEAFGRSGACRARLGTREAVSHASERMAAQKRIAACGRVDSRSDARRIWTPCPWWSAWRWPGPS